MQPDDTAAEDDDLRRRHAGHAAEQDAAAAVRLLERPGAHLRGEPAGHLAHRREQRQLAVGRLDRLVGDRGDAGVDEGPRQRLVCGDVEVREERQALAEPAVLLGDRLLHLEQQLGRVPDVVDRRDPRSDGDVRLVGESGADTRSLLDDHLVAALDELERSGGRQRDAVLALLDLLGDSDPHRGGTIQERAGDWRQPDACRAPRPGSGLHVPLRTLVALRRAAGLRNMEDLTPVGAKT